MNVPFDNKTLEIVGNLTQWSAQSTINLVDSPKECAAWCINEIVRFKEEGNVGYKFLIIPLFMFTTMLLCRIIHQNNDDMVIGRACGRIALWIEDYGFMLTVAIDIAIAVWFIYWRTIV